MTRDEMEARRLSALEKFQQDWIPARVAQHFGVSRTAALRWRDRIQAGEDLNKRKSTGRMPRLTPAQKQKVLLAMERGASTQQLHDFILDKFEVDYNLDYCYRLRGIPRLDRA